MPKIQLRQDLSGNWRSRNPILLIGELGIETDTNKFKIGDGETSWNSLDYITPTKTSDLTNDSGYINISAVPTLTSQLTNDSGFLTSHQDLSNKQDKLTAGRNITIDENNVISSADVSATTNYDELINKPQINGITLSSNKTSADLGIITSSDIPTKTSDLTNDSGFINISSVPTQTSQLNNDSGYLTTTDLNNYAAKTYVDNSVATKQDLLTSENAGTDISITTGGAGDDVTASGTGSVLLENAEADSLNSVTLTGGCEQTVTPSPSTPVDIATNNGNITVSPNLFRTLGTTTTQGGVTYTPQADGSVICTGRATGYYSYYLGRADFDPSTIDKITVAINGTYNASGNIVVDKFHVYSGSTSLGTISYTNWTQSLTVDIANDYPTADNIRVYLKRNSNTDTNAVIQPMAVKGTVNKAWKPYGKIYITGTTETVTDEEGNTATAENLLAVGDYSDTQELLSGLVTHNVGIKVLDGTEGGTWSISSGVCTKTLAEIGIADAATPSAYSNIMSTHFIGSAFTPAKSINNGVFITTTGTFGFSTSEIGTNNTKINNWLKSQYQSGFPVIVIYSLDTETTETVTGQTLTTIDGNNTLTISQASINNLPISANYTQKAGMTINFTNDTGYITSSALSGYVQSSDLATVATTGDYSDLSGTPTIPTTTNDLVNNSGFITNAVNDLTNYYTKSETYTQAEVQGLIANIPNFTVSVVQQLPQTGTDLVLYFVPKNGTSPDVYDEYIWVNNAYELIGNTQVDLSNYVTTSDLTTTLADYATENWVGQQGYLVNDDIVSREVVSSSKLFSNESANGYLETIRTYTLSDLFKVDIIQKCCYSGSNYYTGVKSPFLVLYKDANNYFGIERQGYKLRLINVVNGSTANVEEWSTGVNSINTYLNIYLSLDLSNKKMKIVGSNGTPTTIYTFDFSSWSLSALGTFKIRTSGGKYAGHQYCIYLRTNDYYDYESILNLKFQVNSYNTLPIIADGEGNYTPTTLYIEGSNIVTTSDTHKTADVSIATLNYLMLSSGYDDLLDKYYVSSLVKFRITSGSAAIHAGVGITAFYLMDENSNVLYNGIGASENYTLTNNTWYYLYIVGAGNQTYNYTRRYNAKFEGTFTIEAEALAIGYPRSMNCCAENFDGQYFSGSIPMTTDKTTFTEVTFTNLMNGYQVPVGAIYVDSGKMYIYDGTAWIDFSKYMINKATGTGGITVLGTAASANYAINIGSGTSMAGATGSVAIGAYATANSGNSVVLGYNSKVGSSSANAVAIGNAAQVSASTSNAIQIGKGTNSTANSLQIGFNGTNYQLLDGSTGLIPSGRIPIDGSTITTNASGQLVASGGGSITLDQTYDSTSTNAQSGVAIAGAGFLTSIPSIYLKNTATGSSALTLLGTATTYNYAINIGVGSSAGTGSTSIGTGATATTISGVAIGRVAASSGNSSIAIGDNANVSHDYCILLGRNTTSSRKNTFTVGGFYDSSTQEWKQYGLLDGTDGLILDARLSSNIARTSQIPTATSALTNDSGYVTLNDVLFIAEYGTTTYTQIGAAITAGKNVICHKSETWGDIYANLDYFQDNDDYYSFSNFSGSGFNQFFVNSSDTWGVTAREYANTDLSNLSATGKTVIDGGWVKSEATAFSGRSLSDSSTALDVDLSSYLPNDNYAYEVLVKGIVSTGSTSGNYIYLQAYTALTETLRIAEAQTRANASVEGAGCALIPVGAAKTFKVPRNTSFNGTATLIFTAYRRLGTNS